MMNLELSQPKAKRFCSANATYNPFPVQIVSDKKFIGIFTGLNVHVIDEESIQQIYANGCFGVSSHTKTNLKVQSIEVVHRSRFERKLEWSKKYTNQNPKNVRLKVVADSVNWGRHANAIESDGVNVIDMDDPFPIEDTLVLTLEEAFFLHFALDCLRIMNFDQSAEFTTDDVVQKFCDHNNRFVERYVAYHYYRSRNWIVKSGIKFGGDFCKLLFMIPPYPQFSNSAAFLLFTPSLFTSFRLYIHCSSSVLQFSIICSTLTKHLLDHLQCCTIKGQIITTPAT